MVHASGILDIVEIIYFAPALLVSLYVCYKHGFSREAGWLLLSILALVRVLGAAIGLAAEDNPSTGLITASLILGSIGSATLVAAFTGIANRIETGSGQSHLSPRSRKLVQLCGIVSIVMGIIAGTKIGSSNPEEREDSYTYIQVAAVLILVQYVATLVILSFSALNMRFIMACDRTLFFLTVAAAPFVLVRVIYTLCAAFHPTSSTFSIESTTITAVIIRAFLAVAMEIIAVTIFIAGGLLAPKVQQAQTVRSEAQEEEYQPKYQFVSGETRYQPLAFQQPNQH